jgi:hypothetical protein
MLRHVDHDNWEILAQQFRCSVVLECSFDEAVKQRVWSVGLAEEFWVELAGNVEGMTGQFDHFSEFAFGGDAADDEA